MEPFENPRPAFNMAPPEIVQVPLPLSTTLLTPITPTFPKLSLTFSRTLKYMLEAIVWKKSTAGTFKMSY
jgi:hypothetical protein